MHSHIGEPHNIRPKLTTIKWEIKSNIIIIGDFNTPLLPVDRQSKQQINRERQALNDTLDQLELIDMYREFHSKAIFHFFSFSLKGAWSIIHDRPHVGL